MFCDRLLDLIPFFNGSSPAGPFNLQTAWLIDCFASWETRDKLLPDKQALVPGILSPSAITNRISRYDARKLDLESTGLQSNPSPVKTD